MSVIGRNPMFPPLAQTSVLNLFKGDMGELIIYNQNPSAGDRTLIINYLKSKWGIT